MHTKIKVALCLFHYFPYGGLQKKCFRVARACQQRGHTVHIFTMEWQGQQPEGCRVHLIASQGYSNHRRAEFFAQQFQKIRQQQHFDCVIGFNRMPGIDLYYAADVCFAELLNSRPMFFRYLARYRTYLKLEQQLFQQDFPVRCLFISEQQQSAYLKHYPLSSEQYTLLPPGISFRFKERLNQETAEQQVCKQLGWTQLQPFFLFVGSSFQRKGLMRVIKTFAYLLKTAERTRNFKLLIIGEDSSKKFQQFAKKNSLKKNLHFLGALDDLRPYYQTALALLHPAVHESAGNILLEALQSHLPIVVTSSCGYASFVDAAACGVVLAEPFQQTALHAAVLLMTDKKIQSEFRTRAQQFSENHDFFGLVENVVLEIEKIGINLCLE